MAAVHSPGTWRRLKIASEARQGHGIPRLPESELVRLLGLLAGIRDGEGQRIVGDEAAQEAYGREQRSRLGREPLGTACLRLAQAVDVRPFL